jgi:2-polyprenyl-6-methoxyphenol hydroxylase-like FAD-dependent oxidoreductase
MAHRCIDFTTKQEAMAAEKTHIAVIGAGIGGLTLAASLLRLGFSVEVYEQARQFAVTREQNFVVESWSTKGDKDTLLAAFAGCHPQLRAILAAAPELRKWALLERDPMPSWGTNSVLLLGDACHPMMSYMAQGAACAIEDAVALARCLARVSCNEIPNALAVYAANRKERTARMQLTNRENTWLRFRTDTDWVYDFDAWQTELAGLENARRGRSEATAFH